jgi:glycosyltransferase involved in cell wall biosynthesis
VKRLLAVSWEMPPMYGPRATQVSRTLTQLAVLGWRPAAVCLAPRRGGPHWPDGHTIEPPRGVDLLRVASPEEWLIVRALWRAAPGLRDFPDPARLWVGRAARAAVSAAASGEYAGVVSFAQPWSDHLAGLRVHRETGLPWVAHFSDPWADSPYATPHQRAIWRRMEEDVVREASAVVFVTSETVDLVMAKYPEEWRRKVFVVPHGFEMDPSQAAPSRQADHRGRPMPIVHTGRFNAGVRTPMALLHALARLRSSPLFAGALELSFVGPHTEEFASQARALGVSDLVSFVGRVPAREATARAADADVLLVIDAPSRGPSPFLPSKLIDYLPLRKPILGVTPQTGATAGLLRRLGGVVAPPDDIAAIEHALVDLVGRWRSGTLAVGPAFDSVAAEFEIARTTARLHDVLIHAFDQRRSH